MTDVCCPDDDEPRPEKPSIGQTIFRHRRSKTTVVEVKRRALAKDLK